MVKYLANGIDYPFFATYQSLMREHRSGQADFNARIAVRLI